MTGRRRVVATPARRRTHTAGWGAYAIRALLERPWPRRPRLDRPAFVCDAQAAVTADALTRLHDREALAIHARSYGCAVILPLDEPVTGAWRDRYRLHR